MGQASDKWVEAEQHRAEAQLEAKEIREALKGKESQ
jgi:hypothetical protein